MKNFERLVLVGIPWFFGIILLIAGILLSILSEQPSISTLLICTGLICMSLYCVCSLLAKIVQINSGEMNKSD